LTEKDRRDLEFALTLNVDWVALSFVQRAADMADLRKLVGGRSAVIAKIEKPAAIWGIQPRVTSDIQSSYALPSLACEEARRLGAAKPGQRVLVLAGLPMGTPSSANLLRLVRA